MREICGIVEDMENQKQMKERAGKKRQEDDSSGVAWKAKASI